MGNEAGKGKYSKMDHGDTSEDSGINKTRNDTATSLDELDSASSIKTTTKQGINCSGYHSIGISPKAAENTDIGGSSNAINLRASVSGS